VLHRTTGRLQAAHVSVPRSYYPPQGPFKNSGSFRPRATHCTHPGRAEAPGRLPPLSKLRLTEGDGRKAVDVIGVGGFERPPGIDSGDLLGDGTADSARDAH